MQVLENIIEAFNSVRANLLRSILTLVIIAVGIACLVGMLTAIDTILYSMSNNFNRLGANSFKVHRQWNNIKSNQKGRQRKRAAEISFSEAVDFSEKYKYGGSRVSVDSYCTGNAVVKYGDEKSNPTVRLVGVDENYLYVSAYELSAGRNFSPNEVQSGTNRVIIGKEIVKMLFDDKPEKSIGKTISIGNGKYKVIGALKQKGNSSGGGNDRRVFIPLMKAKMLYGHSKKNYNITVSVADATKIDDAVSVAIGTMRGVRKLKAIDENDFRIQKSDGILEQLKDMTTELRLITIAIACMTLLGAAIGLMNIMLVTVTERTKEIGVRKALGATRTNILTQFLAEAVMICQLGGLVGIVLGIIVGFGVAAGIKGQFIIPWQWMILAMFVCLIVGVLSGLYPALKAARLDPIESLRHE